MLIGHAGLTAGLNPAHQIESSPDAKVLLCHVTIEGSEQPVQFVRESQADAALRPPR